jgi:hypothetical protein
MKASALSRKVISPAFAEELKQELKAILVNLTIIKFSLLSLN